MFLVRMSSSLLPLLVDYWIKVSVVILSIPSLQHFSSSSFSGLFEHLKITDLHGISSLENWVGILVTDNDLEWVAENRSASGSLHM